MHAEKDSEKQQYLKQACRKPSTIWVNTVELDSRETVNVRNWKRESMDR
jgi:hypothetical protein